MSLAEHWRSARPSAAGVHVDSAACSRQSFAVIDAAASHARHEAEVGGYVAAEAAEPVLDAGRAAVGALTGMAAADVVFTTGSGHALDLLLAGWTGDRTIACLPGEYGPNLVIMAARGFEVRHLPADARGRLVVDEAAAGLAADPPALAHLTALGSHRGILQPLAEFTAECRRLGLPLVVDAAQALGHVDCAVGPDAIYSSSRKWMAGPRGVGVLAVRPGLLPEEALGRLAHAEANVAARLAFSVAVGEHLSAGTEHVHARLAEVGRTTREALAGLTGWRVVEPVDEPTAITTLESVDGLDPHRVRSWLIAERRVVTTAIGIERAPLELRVPALRVSPHVDVTAEDLAVLVESLATAPG
jgi:pyridoxal 5-phosphate dependent beta-lyase